VPTLTLGGLGYLPLFRYRLTPYGTEWALVNELGGPMRPAQLELRVGRALRERPWGLSLRQRHAAAWREWTVDLAGGVWRQPRFAASAGEPFPAATRFGMHLRGRIERPLIPVWFSATDAAIVVEVGGKSAGFVPGEPLGGGVTVRAGVGLPLAH
jgi:hypothetical protein